VAWCLVKHRNNFTFTFTSILRGYIQKFPDWVDNEINNKHVLRSNTKGYGGKTHYIDSQNSDTTAPSGRELYHLQFSLRTASPETFGYTLMYLCVRLLKATTYTIMCVYPDHPVSYLMTSSDNHEPWSLSCHFLQLPVSSSLFHILTWELLVQIPGDTDTNIDYPH
jgi:hypothetical protein